MDSEQTSDRATAPSPVTFDRDRLLDLVGDLERDIALVETAMEDIERDNYDSVDAALVALTSVHASAAAASIAEAPTPTTALMLAPTTALMVAPTPPVLPPPFTSAPSFSFAHLGPAPNS
jgi:hypothetical protein